MRSGHLVILFLVGFVLIFPLGCKKSEVKPAQISLPKMTPLGEESRPIQLSNVVFRLKRGEDIGQFRRGVLCIPIDERAQWMKGDLKYNDASVDKIFTDELKNAGYNIVGDPTSLFKNKNEEPPELLIGANINKVHLDVCYPKLRKGDYVNGKGDMSITTEWQVYSTLEGKVVFTKTTKGYAKIEEKIPHVGIILLDDAFGAAVQNLLADEDFYALTHTGEKKDNHNENKKIPETYIKKLDLFETKLEDHIDDVRMAVVTIKAGSGHGSGFFIDERGYLLTAAHVVGGAKFVKIGLVTGRVLAAEVLYADHKTDTALLKAEYSGVIPLPLRRKQPGIGKTVYAIGTPLHEELQSTLTKGIISSYRIDENKIKYIQSDVTIHPGNSGGPLLDEYGNVVGHTNMAMQSNAQQGFGIGLNLFVTINQAIEDLNIQFE